MADRLAREMEVSRNDALLRLAARGARQYEEERRIAEVRALRWAAALPDAIDPDRVGLPSVDEAEQAVRAGREP
jgi:hypothetical protein